MIGALQSCMAAGFSSALGLAPSATPIVISQICLLWGTTLALYCLAKKVATPAKTVLGSIYLNRAERPSYLIVKNSPPTNTAVKNGLLMSVTATLALSILLLSEGMRKGCQFP